MLYEPRSFQQRFLLVPPCVWSTATSYIPRALRYGSTACSHTLPCAFFSTQPRAFPHRVSVSSLLTSPRIPSARFPDLFPHSLHRAFLPAIPRVFPLSSPCVFRAFRHSFPRVLCSCVTHRRRFAVARALCQTKYYFSYKIYLLLFFGLN